MLPAMRSISASMNVLFILRCAGGGRTEGIDACTRLVANTNTTARRVHHAMS
jgi:hypothetical protein